MEEESRLELKAKICGYLAGDGTIKSRVNNKKSNGLRYDIGFFPDDLLIAEDFNKAFYELYGRKFHIRKRNDCNCYEMRSCHKEAFLDLIRVTKFGIHKWRVPILFLEADSMKREWLRAFFDSEASVGKNRIQIQSVNKTGLEEVKMLLEKVGIETSKIYEYKRKNKNWSNNYLLEIRKKPNLNNYLKSVGFTHSIKKAKLMSLVAGVAEPGLKRHAREKQLKKKLI